MEKSGTIETHRHGFTMIEILVVITVIVLLMTLLIGASWNFVVGSRETATRTTIMKIDGIIHDRLVGMANADFEDGAMWGMTQWNADFKLSEAIIRKQAVWRAFPQAFSELGTADHLRIFGAAMPPTNPEYDPKYESGIVLYGTMLKGFTYGAPTPKEDTFSGSEVLIAPKTGGLPCLVDAWGEPLRFYRWPTRLIQTAFNGATPNAASLLIFNLPPSVAPQGTTWPPIQTDQDDPIFHISQITTTPLAIAFFTYGGFDLVNKRSYVPLHDPSWFHLPLVVSAGADRQLGLYESTDIPIVTTYGNPNQSVNAGYLGTPTGSLQPLLDNITNRNQRAGGK